MCTSLLSEALATPLLVAGVLVLAWGLRRDAPLVTVAGGALLGGVALARALYLWLAPVLALALLFAPRRHAVARRATHALALLLGCAALVAPWLARCWEVAGRFVPVQAGGSIQLYVASRIDWDPYDEATLWPRFGQDPVGRRFDGLNTAADMVAADAELGRAAWRNIRAAPAAFAAARADALPHLVLNSFDWFTGIDTSFRDAWGQGRWGLLAVKAGLLLLFSALPLVLAALGGRPTSAEGALAAAVCLFTLTAHVPLWIEYRFWLPVVPLLLALAARGAQRLSGGATP